MNEFSWKSNYVTNYVTSYYVTNYVTSYVTNFVTNYVTNYINVCHMSEVKQQNVTEESCLWQEIPVTVD